MVNIDPANEHLPYDVGVDTRDLVDLNQVMEQQHLGPNGGCLYCLDYINANIDWLFEKLEPFVTSGAYIIFDFPGQVELFTHHPAVLSIVEKLTKRDFPLCAVHVSLLVACARQLNAIDNCALAASVGGRALLF